MIPRKKSMIPRKKFCAAYSAQKDELIGESIWFASKLPAARGSFVGILGKFVAACLISRAKGVLKRNVCCDWEIRYNGLRFRLCFLTKVVEPNVMVRPQIPSRAGRFVELSRNLKSNWVDTYLTLVETVELKLALSNLVEIFMAQNLVET